MSKTLLWQIFHSSITIFSLISVATGGGDALMWNMMDVRYWRCVYKRAMECPDPDIRFFLYAGEDGWRGKEIDVRSGASLRYAGWDPSKKNVIIVHGFNGTESKTPMSFIRRGEKIEKVHFLLLLNQ